MRIHIQLGTLKFNVKYWNKYDLYYLNFCLKMKKRQRQRIPQRQQYPQRQRKRISHYSLPTKPKTVLKQKPKGLKSHKLPQKQQNNQSLKNFAIIFLLCFVTFSIGGVTIYVYNLVQESHTMHDQMTSTYKQLNQCIYEKDKVLKQQEHNCEVKLAKQNARSKNGNNALNDLSNKNGNSGLVINQIQKNPATPATPSSQQYSSAVNNQLLGPMGNRLDKFIDLSPPKQNTGPKPQTPVYSPTFQQLQGLNYKKDLIVVTHAGRRVYLQILYKHLKRQADYFFQWHLWVRTTNSQDIKYMQKLQAQNAWIKLIRLDPPKNEGVSMVYFYKQDCQQKKVYLKLDDDIIWMDENFVLKMFDARFKLIDYLLVFPNIINSSIHAHLQQRAGILRYPQLIDYNCNGNGWKKPMIGVSIHKQFLQSVEKDQVDKWRETCIKWQMLDYERVSINALIYYSETIRSLQFMQSVDDERIYTQVYPKIHQKPVVILGNILCVHAAYATQRKYFSQYNPQILQTYQQIASKI